MKQFNFFILGLLPLFFLGRNASAALGGGVQSVNEDAAAIGTTATKQVLANYTVYSFSVGEQNFKEFVSNQGKVFAISWQCSIVPDLSQLLGDYLDDYVAETTASSHTRQGRQPVSVSTADITVVRGGQMRNFHGKGYVNNLLPAAVKLEDIQ